MRFGKVVGNVVLSQCYSTLRGARWLVVVPMGRKQFENLESGDLGDEPSTIVYDSLGARVGDIIGFTEGGEASLPFDQPMPIDSYNAAVVERVNFVGA
jgi:microcompartment protein CcmK/EutM